MYPPICPHLSGYSLQQIIPPRLGALPICPPIGGGAAARPATAPARRSRLSAPEAGEHRHMPCSDAACRARRGRRGGPQQIPAHQPPPAGALQLCPLFRLPWNVLPRAAGGALRVRRLMPLRPQHFRVLAAPQQARPGLVGGAATNLGTRHHCLPTARASNSCCAGLRCLQEPSGAFKSLPSWGARSTPWPRQNAVPAC